MEILLVDRKTVLNRIVRYKTKSPWGHVAVVIDDKIYEFDHNNKRVGNFFEEFHKDDTIQHASLYKANMLYGDREAEEYYHWLFNRSQYDINALSELYKRDLKHRNFDNIQTGSNLYTCSNLLARVFYDMYEEVGCCPHFLTDFHWSQAVPNDFSGLEKIVDLK